MKRNPELAHDGVFLPIPFSLNCSFLVVGSSVYFNGNQWFIVNRVEYKEVKSRVVQHEELFRLGKYLKVSR